MGHGAALERELEQTRMRQAGLAAERDAYLRQRDEAIGERNEFLRQRDEAIVAGDRRAAHMAHLQAGAYGIDDYDLSRIKPPTVGERNFREGGSGTWRAEFSEEDQAFAASLMGSRIERIPERIVAP